MYQFRLLKSIGAPQSRRGRREKLLLLSVERTESNKLRYPPGYFWPKARFVYSIPPLTGLNRNTSLCELCGSAVNKNPFLKT
jgi:hypothetical protein